MAVRIGRKTVARAAGTTVSRSRTGKKTANRKTASRPVKSPKKTAVRTKPVKTSKNNTPVPPWKKREAALKKVEAARKAYLQLIAQEKPLKVGEYVFHRPNGGAVNLSELFGSSDELMVIHNMGKKCRYCTLWADGFNGVYQHLSNRAPFVVVSPDPVEVMREFAQGRGWKFTMLSAHGTKFFFDMGFASENDDPWPGVSTFRRDANGRIYRVKYDSFGPGDPYCGVWHLLDLLPNGTNKWEPQYHY